MNQSESSQANLRQRIETLVIWAILLMVILTGVLFVSRAPAIGSVPGLLGMLLVGSGTLLYADHAWRVLPQKFKERQPNITRAFLFLIPVLFAFTVRYATNAL